MMYGFGDDENPLDETAMLLEDMVFEYVERLAVKIQALSPNKSKMRKEDILFFIKNDRRRYVRIKELIYSDNIAKKANETFDYKKPIPE